MIGGPARGEDSSAGADECHLRRISQARPVYRSPQGADNPPQPETGPVRKYRVRPVLALPPIRTRGADDGVARFEVATPWSAEFLRHGSTVNFEVRRARRIEAGDAASASDQVEGDGGIPWGGPDGTNPFAVFLAVAPAASPTARQPWCRGLPQPMPAADLPKRRGLEIAGLERACTNGTRRTQ